MLFKLILLGVLFIGTSLSLGAYSSPHLKVFRINNYHIQSPRRQQEVKETWDQISKLLSEGWELHIAGTVTTGGTGSDAYTTVIMTKRN